MRTIVVVVIGVLLGFGPVWLVGAEEFRTRESSQSLRCDLDQNGMCDDKDRLMFSRAALSCVGDERFVSRADANNDQCITLKDSYIIFGEPPKSAKRDISELSEEAYLLWHGHQHAAAIKKAEEAADTAERVLGPDDLDFANTLHDLGGYYQLSGFYGRAEPLLQREFAIRERRLGGTNPQLATAIHNLAHFYHRWSSVEEKRSQDAEQLYVRGLRLVDQAGDTYVQDKLDLLAALGELHYEQNRAQEAQATFQRAFEFWKSIGRPRAKPWGAWLQDYVKVLRQAGEGAAAQAVEASWKEWESANTDTSR